MPKISSEQAKEKWKRNLKGASQSIKDGVANVKDNPSEKAAAASDRWRDAMAKDKTLDKYKKGLGRVSLSQWKDAILNKGLSRLNSGVDAGEGKFGDFTKEFFSHLESVEAEVKDMPKKTIEDSVNRAAHVIRRNAEFERS